MARPIKQGIDYYPLDVNFLADIKTRKIMRACGNESIGILISILSNIYRDNGYFIEVDDDFNFLVADEINVQEDEVKEVILKAVEVGFFDSTLYSAYKILTSQGIQSRYIKACEKRKRVEVEKGYSLLADGDVKGNVNLVINLLKGGETIVNDPDNSIDDVRSTQSKVKERIVKERIVKDSTEDVETLEINFRKLWDLYPKKSNQFESFEFYKIAIGKGTTNKEIQTGIINYIKHLNINKTENRFVKTDVNFFKDKYWMNHQSEPVAKFGQKDESTPEWFKKQKEQQMTPEPVTESVEPAVDDNEAAILARMKALGIGGDDD